MPPGPTPTPLAVTAAQRAVPAALLRRSWCPQALALRVRIILAAAAGRRNEPLARQPGCTPKPARKWRSRWRAAVGPLPAAGEDRDALARAIAAALADASRPGAPATFTAGHLLHLLHLACHPPEHFGRPVAAWTPRDLADEAVTQGIVSAISSRPVGRFVKRGRAAAPAPPLLAQRQGQG